MSEFVICPNCGKKVARVAQQPWRPFCSERCRLIDLGKWVGEEHRIPAEEHEEHTAVDDTAAEPSR